MKKKKEDSRLKKIRFFKGNSEDFKSYINSKIKETKNETHKTI